MARTIRVSAYINEEAEPGLFKILDTIHAMRRADRLRYYATVGVGAEFKAWKRGMAVASGQTAGQASAEQQTCVHPVRRHSESFSHDSLDEDLARLL